MMAAIRPMLESISDSGKTMNLVADICWGGAIVAAGVTTYLFVSRPHDTKKTEARNVHVVPAFVPGGAGVFVSGVTF